MYRIKPRKIRYIPLITICFLAIAAIGIGISYAGMKIKNNEVKKDIKPLSTSDVSVPLPTSFIEETSKTAANTESDFPTSSPTFEFTYLIKLENGKTKVYSITENSMVYSHELPISLGAIPESDKKALENGIYLKTHEELLSFTEDFCS